MPFLEIITYPHPILRKIAKPVENITDEIVQFSKNMLERMYLARSAGLAANRSHQVATTNGDCGYIANFIVDHPGVVRRSRNA